MPERKTPQQRMTEFLNNTMPGIVGKFPAFTTNSTTNDLSAMVSDVDNSGAEITPPLDPDSIQNGGD